MTGSPVLLTIGIPTYNFGRFIGETLASVIHDLPDNVEVLVVDGASTDDSEAIVTSFAEQSLAVRYVRLPERGGIDADIAKTVEIARGKFVWLCSADDVLYPGAVAQVLTLLAKSPDVLLLAHSNCTIDLRPVTSNHPIVTGEGGRFAIVDRDSRVAYFATAATSEALFSFCSGLILRREAWDAAPVPREFFWGSCWGHAARLLALMNSPGLTIDVETTPLLARRGENDSFRKTGIVKRFAIAIEGYPAIVAFLFGEDGPEIDHTRRVLRNEFGFKQFVFAKMEMVPGVDDPERLRRMFVSLYGGGARGWLWQIAYRTIPRRALIVLAGMLRRLKKRRAK